MARESLQVPVYASAPRIFTKLQKNIIANTEDKYLDNSIFEWHAGF